VTKNLEQRLKQHNGQLPGGAKRTKGRGPFQVMFQLDFLESRSIAQKIESCIKKLSRQEKEQLVEGNQAILNKVQASGKKNGS
jgi:putative endonuclease